MRARGPASAPRRPRRRARAGVIWLGGTLYSPRICRMLATISCSALEFARRVAHARRAPPATPPSPGTRPGARPGSFCQSVSVMNGTMGCSRRSAWSKTCTSTARATSPSASLLCRRVLIASTYQSASSFHANRRAASAYSSRRSPRFRSSTGHVPFAGRAWPSAASQSAMAASRRDRIHASAGRSDFASKPASGGGAVLADVLQQEAPDVPQLGDEVAPRRERLLEIVRVER